jgi:hypothetical protein
MESREGKTAGKSKKKVFVKEKHSSAGHDDDAPQLSRKEQAELKKIRKATRQGGSSIDLLDGDDGGLSEKVAALTTGDTKSRGGGPEKKLTKKQIQRQQLHEKEAADAAAKAAAAVAAPTDTEAAGAEEEGDGVPQLHLLTSKQQKKHVKKLQNARKQEKLPDLTEGEIAAIFAFPASEEPVAE